jgi:hypothetical protein
MALAGEYIVVKMDDAGATLRTFADGDITSVDLGLDYDQYEVTGFGDLADRFINWQLKATVTLKGNVTATASIGTHTVIQGVYAAGAQVTLRVAVGSNSAPQVGVSPEFSGEFFVESYKPVIEMGKAVTFEAMLKPATGNPAPVWGTMA